MTIVWAWLYPCRELEMLAAVLTRDPRELPHGSGHDRNDKAWHKPVQSRMLWSILASQQLKVMVKNLEKVLHE